MTARRTPRMHPLQLSAGILGLLLAGCQSTGSDLSFQERNQREIAAELLRMEVRIGEEARSLASFTVNGFRAINEQSLVPYAFAVGLQSQTTNVTSFDSIIVRSLHGRPERCRIDRIYHLDDVAPAAQD